MVLGERLAQELKELYTKLNNEGKLLSKAQLEGYYETFRKRFGPDQLKSVDGEALLVLMHDHGNHDSLVYWLEFKNDAEFPVRFGSIAGGPQTFQDLLIHQLAAKASELLSRGLHRRYVRCNQQLSSPRGRIDIHRIVRDGGLSQATLACIVHPRIEDCLVNQVLLAGLRLGARLTIDLVLRATLKLDNARPVHFLSGKS